MSQRLTEKQKLYDGKKPRLELHHLEHDETGKRHVREVRSGAEARGAGGGRSDRAGAGEVRRGDRDDRRRADSRREDDRDGVDVRAVRAEGRTLSRARARSGKWSSRGTPRELGTH